MQSSHHPGLFPPPSVIASDIQSRVNTLQEYLLDCFIHYSELKEQSLANAKHLYSLLLPSNKELMFMTHVLTLASSDQNLGKMAILLGFFIASIQFDELSQKNHTEFIQIAKYNIPNIYYGRSPASVFLCKMAGTLTRQEKRELFLLMNEKWDYKNLCSAVEELKFINMIWDDLYITEQKQFIRGLLDPLKEYQDNAKPTNAVISIIKHFCCMEVLWMRLSEKEKVEVFEFLKWESCSQGKQLVHYQRYAPHFLTHIDVNALSQPLKRRVCRLLELAMLDRNISMAWYEVVVHCRQLLTLEQNENINDRLYQFLIAEEDLKDDDRANVVEGIAKMSLCVTTRHRKSIINDLILLVESADQRDIAYGSAGLLKLLWVVSDECEQKKILSVITKNEDSCLNGFSTMLLSPTALILNHQLLISVAIDLLELLPSSTKPWQIVDAVHGIVLRLTHREDRRLIIDSILNVDGDGQQYALCLSGRLHDYLVISERTFIIAELISDYLASVDDFYKQEAAETLKRLVRFMTTDQLNFLLEHAYKNEEPNEINHSEHELYVCLHKQLTSRLQLFPYSASYLRFLPAEVRGVVRDYIDPPDRWAKRINF